MNDKVGVVQEATSTTTVAARALVGRRGHARDTRDRDESTPFYDPELGLANPVEVAHLKLARGTRLARADRDLKPLTSELQQLTSIINTPPTHTLDTSEAALVWKFRYYLQANPRALPKFLATVDFSAPSETERALALMETWEPVDVADALQLLSNAFPHPAVRRYAVARLGEASDDELNDYLLQLVQAMPVESSDGSVPAVASPLVHFVLHRATRNAVLANFLQWYLYVEANDKSCSKRAFFGDVLRMFRSQLVEPLVDNMLMSSGSGKSSTSSSAKSSAKNYNEAGGGGDDEQEDVANNNSTELGTVRNYGQLNSDGVPESEATTRSPSLPDDVDLGQYDSGSSSTSNSRSRSDLSERLKKPLGNAPTSRESVGRRMQGVFAQQQRLMSRLSALARDIKAQKLSRPKKIEKLREWIEKGKYDLDRFPAIPLPLDPTISVCGIRASSAHVYKSAMQPLGFDFITTTGTTYPVIFKTGDDLRQDQFVVQLIRIMDRILKREQLDLHLTPYAVLATSNDEGLVQRIPSTSVAGVLKNYKQIAKFLDDKGAPLDHYIKSCAGYAVISYILGLGDRHLDNLLLTDDGKLFHIDFGYILGRDPKYTISMKLTKEMVEGMGGIDSRHYQQFKLHCCEAYNLIRQSASLLLNLFTLMLDSSVPDVVLEGERAVLKLQEKLRLEMTAEEAEVAFQQLVDDSVS
eukprot:CAMPEP_0168606302 /NCGR_PEP_ID=MMETSP0420-20121227/16492_1 /TAXON_ID=498008 /ORGANISM="Pessonella sp." /LENGTH=695 /DNA_ID=CAMNT_0008645945 /DNA_START=408 /DNA_END=2493 /DNA_ORIENTATION=+